MLRAITETQSTFRPDRLSNFEGTKLFRTVTVFERSRTGRKDKGNGRKLLVYETLFRALEMIFL